MAVEDGAVLGRLLHRFTDHRMSKTSLPALLQLYQRVRKTRAQTTVRTANSNRLLYRTCINTRVARITLLRGV